MQKWRHTLYGFINAAKECMSLEALLKMEAAIDQWIRVLLQYCGPGLESQAQQQQQRFSN